MQQVRKKGLYAPTYHFHEGFLNIPNSAHRLFYREYGNAEGIPAVVFHGGPGAGCDYENHPRFFNPKHYRIILVDQRGSGLSKPHGWNHDNTTQNLCSDMELLRRHLGIEKWVILGGSWGSTLALIYGITYPKQVEALILRGIFLGRDQDIQAFFSEDCVASKLFPKQWQHTLEIVPLMNQDRLIDYYYQQITKGSPTERHEALARFAGWEESISRLSPPSKIIEAKDISTNSLNMAQIEINYLYHHLYIPENYILNHLNKLNEIPVQIIQGQWDVVCPAEQAITLSEQLSHVKLAMTIAGHSAMEKGNIDAIIQATDSIAYSKKSS